MVEVRLVGMYAGVVIGVAGESFGFFCWEICSSLHSGHRPRNSRDKATTAFLGKALVPHTLTIYVNMRHIN